MRKFFYLIVLVSVMTACGTGAIPNSGNQTKPDEPLPSAEAEVKEGDFIYRLFTEKDVYNTFSGTAIFAELTYVGELDSIDIYHSASPFYFPLEERTRGIIVDYPMDEPLIVTTLEMGEPLRQSYGFAGGYSDIENEEYVNFVKTLIDKGFPEGEYIIHGSAEFWTEEPPGVDEKNNYLLKADIGFTVMEPYSR